MLDAIEEEDDVIAEYFVLTVIQERETIEEFYW